jgi:hypothetical protein
VLLTCGVVVELRTSARRAIDLAVVSGLSLLEIADDGSGFVPSRAAERHVGFRPGLGTNVEARWDR